jgi:hypothetical protein
MSAIFNSVFKNFFPWIRIKGGSISGTKITPPTSDKTDNYNITSADFGKSLRMNSASDKIFNSPSVRSTDDGARITIEKLNVGKVTFNCADNDKVADSNPGGAIYNNIAAEIDASITLEYVHAVTTWFVISAHGTWITTT